MTYQRPFNAKRSGFILVDAVLAIVLSAAMVGMMTGVSLSAKEALERAQDKHLLLSGYKSHAPEFVGMLPGEERSRSYAVGSSTDLTTISAIAKQYGNDRVETDISVSLGSLPSVEFAAVNAYLPGDHSDVAGTPLCSADFESGASVGSYGYFSGNGEDRTVSIMPIMLPIDPALSLTDLIVRDGVAYISADSPKAADPDLLVVDISSEKSPVMISAINTGPGLAAITMAGRYIYGAARSAAAQLHVIKVDSPSSLSLVSRYKLPLPEASTSPPIGSAIFYDTGKLYLGTEKWDGQELSIIDIHVPEEPSKISGLKIDSKVNAILVMNGIVYIATSGQGQLTYADVSDPVRPFVASMFSPSGWQRQDGKSLASFEGSVILGRTSGGFNIIADKELFFWDHVSHAPVSLDIPCKTLSGYPLRTNLSAGSRMMASVY